MPDSNPEKIKNIIQQLADNPLPVLNPTVPKVTEELGQAVFNYERLGHLLYLDPLCLFNFLAWANNHKLELSPDSEEKIKTPQHAALLLGIDNIERCLKELKPLSSVKDQRIAGKLEKLACRSLHTAYQARNLAHILRSKAAEPIYLSALMMSLAELLVWHIAPEQAQRVELLINTQEYSEEDAQVKVFDFKYHDLVIEMAPQWHLPEMYLSALQTEILGEAKKSILCIKLADKLARHIDFGWYYDEVDNFFDFCEQLTPYHRSRLNKEFHQTALKMAWEAQELYQLVLPAAHIVLETGKIPYQQVISLDKRNSSAGQNNPPNDATIVQINAPANQPDQYREAKNLESAANIPTLIQLTINSLHSSERYQQTIFLMLNKNKSDLIIRMGKGFDEQAIMLKKINVSQQRNLFSILLEKPQSIFVRQEDYTKYQKFINKQMTNLLPATEFCAKALFYHDKPIGLFYVTGQSGLAKEDYDFFRKTLVRFDQHLSKIS